MFEAEVIPLLEIEETSWQEQALCAPDRSGGVLPGEGRQHPRGQAGLRVVRGARRVPRVRPGQRRALRHLGRDVRARASAPQEAGRLIAT